MWQQEDIRKVAVARVDVGLARKDIEAGGGDVAGSFGTFHINSNGTYTYTLNNANATVNALGAGQTLTDSIPYTMSDGSLTSSSTLTVTILRNGEKRDVKITRTPLLADKK